MERGKVVGYAFGGLSMGIIGNILKLASVLNLHGRLYCTVNSVYTRLYRYSVQIKKKRRDKS